MKRASAVVLAGTLLLGAGCSRDPVAPGQARLTFDGRVLVAPKGSPYRPAKDGSTLSAGDKVKVAAGTASLELAGGSMELRRNSEVLVGKVSTLLAGESLVTSQGRPLEVRAADAVARVDGAARLERSLAVTVASYAGAARLTTTGRRLDVPALRQATTPAAGVLPARPSPIAVDEADGWDRRFLGVAIELDRQLETRSTGFTSQLAPAEGRTVGFFKQVLPKLDDEPAFSPQLLEAEREPGETLVGASIALLGTRGSFLSRWASTFAFREDGAAWGIVALDQAVKDVPGLTGTIDAAIGASPLRFALGGFSTPDGGGPTGPPRDGGGSSPTTTTTIPDGNGGGGDEPDPDEPVVNLPDTGTPADPAADPVEQLLDDLIADLSPGALP